MGLFHGVDAREELTFGVRVDGRFSEEIRRQLPRPAANPASAPALRARGARPLTGGQVVRAIQTNF